MKYTKDDLFKYLVLLSVLMIALTFFLFASAIILSSEKLGSLGGLTLMTSILTAVVCCIMKIE